MELEEYIEHLPLTMIIYRQTHMGNSHPKQQQTTVQGILQHPRFAKARLTIDKKLVIEYKYSDDFNQLTQKISSLNPKNQKLPLLLPKMQMTHAQNFCGVDKTINLIFNYYRFTLHEEIAKRKEMKLSFEETELWFLLFNLTHGSSTFQKKKQKAGDIRPRNVLIDEKGNVAILNHLSFPDELTNYYKSLYHKERTYLAPEELAELQNKIKYCKSDPVIAESFSIGLTMLDACLLLDCQELYDFQEFSFKNYQFQDHLVALKSLNMSPFFIKTVLNLLEVQVYNRPTPGQVFAIIQPYQQDILNLAEFVPDRKLCQQSLQTFQNNRF